MLSIIGASFTQFFVKSVEPILYVGSLSLQSVPTFPVSFGHCNALFSMTYPALQ